jgi:hypothetical protein
MRDALSTMRAIVRVVVDTFFHCFSGVSSTVPGVCRGAAEDVWSVWMSADGRDGGRGRGRRAGWLVMDVMVRGAGGSREGFSGDVGEAGVR